jgi:hypothetical protein
MSFRYSYPCRFELCDKRLDPHDRSSNQRGSDDCCCSDHVRGIHSDGRRHQQAAAWNLTKARRVVAARTLGSVLWTTNATLTAQSIVRPLLTPTRTVKINTAAAAATSSNMVDADEIELWNETTVAAEPTTAKMTKKDASSTDTTTTTPFVPIFLLIDPTSAQSDKETDAHETEEQHMKENQCDDDDDDGFGETTTTTLHDGNNNNMSTTTGLRQRKAAAANANSSKEWKIEKPAIVEPQLSAQSTTTTTTATTTTAMIIRSSSSPETDLLVALFGTTTTMLPPAELRQAQTQAVAALQTYCRAATHVAAILAALSWSEKQMTNDNNNNNPAEMSCKDWIQL